MSYRPSQQILERYANVLVNWALGGGEGIKPGDVVLVNAEEDAKPLMVEASKAIWRAGGHVIARLLPFTSSPPTSSLTFFPASSCWA
jgi:aminopeptidase